MYSIRLLKDASQDLMRLDKPVAKRIVRKLRWLADNLNDLSPEPLKGEFSGLYKLRQGDYRIIYEILRSEETIVVHLIGHRREVYEMKRQ
jgi:mRNA interferase RelE/StbE